MLRPYLNDFFRESFPASLLVRPRLVSSHRQHRIEKQYPLGCPALQIAVLGNDNAAVTRKLFVNVPQARRDLDTVGHGEAQPHRLANIVVRVLTQDDHSHFAWWARVQCTKNIPGLREDLNTRFPLSLDKTLQIFKVLFRKLTIQCFAPNFAG